MDKDLKIKQLEDKIDDLEAKLSSIEDGGLFTLYGGHDNIVTKMLMDDLFGNLDRIPMNELEELVNKYKA